MTRTVEAKNIFGETIKLPVRGKHYIQPKGYAAPCGTGEKGKTCGDCKHAQRYGKYSKCALARHSACRATDILLRAPACRFFEASVKAFVDGKEVEIKKVTKNKVTLSSPPPEKSIVKIYREKP